MQRARKTTRTRVTKRSSTVQRAIKSPSSSISLNTTPQYRTISTFTPTKVAVHASPSASRVVSSVSSSTVAKRRAITNEQQSMQLTPYMTSTRTFANDMIVEPEPIVQRKVIKPSESQATIFGAAGQIGRMAAAYIGTAGVRMVVPYRDHGMDIREVKLAGDVGQVAPKYYQMNDLDSVYATLKGSDLVVNCIGSYTPTMHYNEHDANVKTAFRIAQASKDMGVNRFIHVSAAGASEHASSKFLQAKWESEQVVKHFYPNATIIRPCFTFAHDNTYLHALAGSAANAQVHNVVFPNTRIQPTYAKDVGAAIAQIALHPEIDGQTWTLGGDKVYTRLELYNTFRKMINVQQMDTNQTIGLSPGLSMARFVLDELGYKHSSLRTTPTHAVDYFQTNVTLDAVPRTKGFAELGIVPTETDLAFVRVCRPFMSLKSSPALKPSLFNHQIM